MVKLKARHMLKIHAGDDRVDVCETGKNNLLFILLLCVWTCGSVNYSIQHNYHLGSSEVKAFPK